MFKSILLPIDLNHKSSWEKPLPTAIELAEKHGSELHLVAVVPDLGMSMIGMYLPEGFEASAIEKTGEALHEFAQANVPESVRGQSHVAHGSVRQEIVTASAALNCDLIMMAPHRPESLDFLLSPVSDYVVTHAKCSVLVVRS